MARGEGLALSWEFRQPAANAVIAAARPGGRGIRRRSGCSATRATRRLGATPKAQAEEQTRSTPAYRVLDL